MIQNEKGEILYRVGLTADAPASHVTVAGVCFPLETSKFSDSGHETRSPGALTYLSKEKVKEILEAAKKDYFVVSRGPNGIVRSWQATVGCNGFTPTKENILLADCLWIEKVEWVVEPDKLERVPGKFISDLEREAMASEQEARKNPKDRQTRLAHADAKANNEKVSSVGDF